MNLLFIFADQMHRYAMGCMGTDDIITPNLDRLAQQGLLFRNAYSNCPVCTPFRIILTTGLYTSQTNTFRNATPIPSGCTTIADVLNNGGYRTSYVGKWHLGGMGNEPIPAELRGGFTDFIGYQCYNGFKKDTWFYDEANREHRFAGHRTDVTTDLAIERLHRLQNQPFALLVSYQAPHYPVQPSQKYEDMYAGVKIKRRPNCQEIDPYTNTFSPPSPWPPDDCPDYQKYGNNLDEYLRLYYALVTQLDANVGRLLQTLHELGRSDDTVVVFTSDHGDMQGSHGLKNKCFPYEESSGIPLIVRVPGGVQNQVTDALVSGVDYFPTCLDWLGLPPQQHLPGTSFAPLTRGEVQVLDGPVFAEMHDWKMVRAASLKLVVEGDEFQPTQFYDLSRDPYELENGVGDPANADAVAALRERIVAWQLQCWS